MTVIISIISFGIGLIIIGVVAGFSFVLYAMQAAVLGDKKNPMKKGLALAAGVASGLLLLAMFFLLVQPETFQIVSIWDIADGLRTNSVDILIGLLGVICGVYVVLLGYRRKVQPVPATRPSAPTKGYGGGAALFSFGFGRAITRVTGVAALLLGVRTITHATDILAVKLGFLIIMLAAAMLPYIIMLAMRFWRPTSFAHIERSLERVKSIRPYRTAGALLVGIGLVFLLLSITST